MSSWLTAGWLARWLARWLADRVSLRVSTRSSHLRSSLAPDDRRICIISMKRRKQDQPEKRHNEWSRRKLCGVKSSPRSSRTLMRRSINLRTSILASAPSVSQRSIATIISSNKVHSRGLTVCRSRGVLLKFQSTSTERRRSRVSDDIFARRLTYSPYVITTRPQDKAVTSRNFGVTIFLVRHERPPPPPLHSSLPRERALIKLFCKVRRRMA